MNTKSDPTAPQQSFGPTWRSEPFPNSPRPWLLAAITLICAGLVVAGSIGPWLYTEDGPARAIEVRTVSGVSTDGVFSLFFALVATIALLGAMLRPTLWMLGWVAFLALVMCSLVGLFDWVMFDPMELVARSTDRPTFVRIEWGLKLLTIAAPVGAVASLLFARRLMSGDY